MYDIIQNILNHAYVQNGQGDQSYIYNCACALIIVFSVWILDRISVFIISTAKGGK